MNEPTARERYYTQAANLISILSVMLLVAWLALLGPVVILAWRAIL